MRQAPVPARAFCFDCDISRRNCAAFFTRRLRNLACIRFSLENIPNVQSFEFSQRFLEPFLRSLIGPNNLVFAAEFEER